MEVVLKLVQRIDLRHFLSKKLRNQGIQRTDKEEVMFLGTGIVPERGIERTLEDGKHLRRRQVEHLAAGRHLAGHPVVGNVPIGQGLAMIDATGARHIGVRGSLRLEGVVPQLAGTVRQVVAQGHRLIAREKRRKALGTNAQVEVTDFHLYHFRFAKRAVIHGF